MAEGIKKISENVTIANRALVITNPSVPDNDAISIGALQSNPADRGLKIKTSRGVYSHFNAVQLLEPMTVTNSLLANKCVTQSKIDNNAIGTEQLINNAVTEIKLADNSITRNKLKNGEVISSKIAFNSIMTTHLADNCIINSKIIDNTIQNSKLADYTITNKKIAQGTINSACLGPNSVTGQKIEPQAIDNSKLKPGSIYGDRIANGAIQAWHLGNDIINTHNILNGAINSDKLADRVIYEKHIADEQITMRHIYPFSVTEGKIHDDAVTTSKIRDYSVNISKLGQDVRNWIGDPVQYNINGDVLLKHHLSLEHGDIYCTGTISASKIYNAVFMDLAEAYTPAPDVTFVPGDIVEIREDGYAYKADGVSVNKAIVGVVSNEYAQCFGATDEEIQNNEKIAVGMIGKVHVNVVGPVKIGEHIGACKDGVGVSTNIDLSLDKKHIIGKALETNESNEPKKVLCLIFPN